MPNGESILETINLNSKTLNPKAKRRIQIKKRWIQKPNGESKLETTNPKAK